MILEALPIKEDFEEAAPVYQTLTALATNPTLASRVCHVRPQLMAALQAVLHQDEVPSPVKEAVLRAIGNTSGSHAVGNGSIANGRS